MAYLPVYRTPAFRKAYRHLPQCIQSIVDEKIKHLARNPAYHSLKAHKLHRVKGDEIWSCSVSVNKRLLYQYKDGKIYLWDVGEHSIVERAHLRSFK